MMIMKSKKIMLACSLVFMLLFIPSVKGADNLEDNVSRNTEAIENLKENFIDLQEDYNNLLNYTLDLENEIENIKDNYNALMSKYNNLKDNLLEKVNRNTDNIKKIDNKVDTKITGIENIKEDVDNNSAWISLNDEIMSEHDHRLDGVEEDVRENNKKDPFMSSAVAFFLAVIVSLMIANYTDLWRSEEPSGDYDIEDKIKEAKNKLDYKIENNYPREEVAAERKRLEEYMKTAGYSEEVGEVKESVGEKMKNVAGEVGRKTVEKAREVKDKVKNRGETEKYTPKEEDEEKSEEMKKIEELEKKLKERGED